MEKNTVIKSAQKRKRVSSESLDEDGSQEDTVSLESQEESEVSSELHSDQGIGTNRAHKLKNAKNKDYDGRMYATESLIKSTVI